MSARHVDESDRVRAALAVIPAEDYATWVDMAFAVKQGLGETGFDLWDEWSRTAHNYEARAARATWRSAEEAGGKTLASLFWLARQHGFDLRGSGAHDERPNGVQGAMTRIAIEPERLNAKIRARQASVAREAVAIWQWARPVGPEHPYLERKQVRAVPALRELEAEELGALLGYVPRSADEPLTGRVLVVPVRIGGTLSTLELIDAQGRKSTLAGGAKAGGCWAVAPDMDGDGTATPIMIAEGVATALSAWQATGWFAVAALSSGNLRRVAATWRGRYPEGELLVLGDRGAGYEHAREAALGTSARLATPWFEPLARIAGQAPTDFNDMAVLGGLQSVGRLLREAAYGELGVVLDGESGEVGYGSAAGSAVDEWKEGEEMSRAKEEMTDDAGHTRPRHASGRKPAREDATTQQSQQSKEETKVVRASTQAADPPPMEASGSLRASTTARRQAGDVLYGLDDVPGEIKALAQHRFGAQIRMATPRENGGPYRGVVFNTEHYLIQEVATCSVVFHAKARMEFISERLRWMDENQRLNGADVQIGYDGERPKVYPWDRTRDQLERTVASLKKSAREVGFDTELDATLEQLQAASWTRIREARAAALAQSKERAAREAKDDPEC